jgi:hypothetical protein
MQLEPKQTMQLEPKQTMQLEPKQTHQCTRRKRANLARRFETLLTTYLWGVLTIRTHPGRVSEATPLVAKSSRQRSSIRHRSLQQSVAAPPRTPISTHTQAPVAGLGPQLATTAKNHLCEKVAVATAGKENGNHGNHGNSSVRRSKVLLKTSTSVGSHRCGDTGLVARPQGSQRRAFGEICSNKATAL